MEYQWNCLNERFQMSTSMRGLLCEGVMIWIPLDRLLILVLILKLSMRQIQWYPYHHPLTQ